jgi:acyl transferase domain-containing protein
VPPADLPAELDAFLPELTEDGLPGVLTSVIAGRVANRLDLGGKNLTVDSACASVLVGLDIACNELAGGSSDLVLLGAVDLHNGPQDYVSFSAAQALSRQGRCRPFDADADGMTLAEGAGCLVLKRLADAERDGDRTYAVVKAVAGSSDGRHLGLTAPRQEGQVKAVRRAYADAGMSPTEVGLVEAHGTGTPTGDRIELGTTTEVFTEAGAVPGSVVLGSVKSNIGHVKCASGIASLIKAARAVYHGVQPPTLNIERPIPTWDATTSPFVFLDQARPWLGQRRVAAVSGFGFGGTNFHALLANHPAVEPAAGRCRWPAELFAFRGETDHAVGARLDELAARLDEEVQPPVQADRTVLRDVAASVSATGEGPVRLALMAGDLADLAAKVSAARSGADGPGVHRAPALPLVRVPAVPQVAFLVPGASAARPGMGAEVLVAFPGVRVAGGIDPGLAGALWPPAVFDGGREVRAQAGGPGVAAVSAAVVATLAALGVRADHTVPAGDGTADEVRRLHDAGVRVFVEVGPTQGLADVAAASLDGRPHVAVVTDRPGEHGLVTLVDAVARLVVAGLPVDLDALHAGRGSRPERWDSPPRRPGWIVNGHFVRTAAGDPLPKGLRPAGEAPRIRLADPAAAPAGATGAAGAPSTGELAVAAEYLRVLEDIIATGGEIIRSHAAPVATAGER